jgi:hypothetical protein
MKLLTRLLAARGMRSQRQVAQRTAYVIERVLFDIGMDRMAQGTMLLDRRLRPRFCGGPAAQVKRPLAAVPLADLAVLAGTGAGRVEAAAMVDGVLREFRLQSTRFQSLP